MENNGESTIFVVGNVSKQQFIMKLVIGLIVVVIVLVMLGLFRYNRDLKNKAKRCSKEAKRFHEKLQQLSAPDRFFTDEEVRKLKIEFAPVLEDVNDLYDSYFISNEYLDKLGLGDFMEERKLLNHKQYINNQGRSN